MGAMEKNPTNTLKPLLIFFGLSFGLILLIALPGMLDHYGLIAVEIPVEPFLILGSWTPNIAAVLVLWWVLNSPGKAKALFRRWTMWREKPQWYLAAASPLLVAAVASLLYQAVVLTAYASFVVAWYGPARLRRAAAIPLDEVERTWLS
jgi:hypothetical protein